MVAALATLAASVLLAAPQAVAEAQPAASPASPPAATAAPAPRPDSATLLRWSREVTGLLAEGKTDDVALRFAGSLVAVLPPWRFSQGWSGIENRAGKLVSFGEPEVRRGSVESVVTPTRFARAEWTTTLQFDGEGRLTSIRFAPSSLAPVLPVAAEWRAPVYVSPKKFRDVDLKLGFAPWVLPATLSLPVGKGPFPAVVLVHDSGPQDQDGTVGAVKPLRDLAWGLASQGIAVLRYEKRTRAHGERMANLTVTVKEEVVDDAVLAIRFLRDNADVDRGRIVLLGHGLGGTLAPRIAAAVPGELAGEVLLAAPVRRVPELVDDQTAHLVSAGVMTEETATNLRAEARKAREIDPRNPPEGKILNAPAAYWIDLAAYDPGATARRNGLPLLLIQGGRDYQSTSKDVEGWRKAFEGTSLARFDFVPDVNHLLVEGQGKSTPAENQMAGNVTRKVVEEIAAWVKALPARR